MIDSHIKLIKARGHYDRKVVNVRSACNVCSISRRKIVHHGVANLLRSLHSVVRVTCSRWVSSCGYPDAMRLKNRFVSLLTAVVLVPLSISSNSVAADGPSFAIFNTDLSNNLGLAVCAADTNKACIESVSVDGVQLAYTASLATATHTVGGGLYGQPCRFVDTESATCQFPYMVINPKSSTPMSEVTVRFRRPMDDAATSRFGSTIVNGRLVSFTPAEKGKSDIATVVARPAEFQIGSTGYCRGFSVAIDTCTISETATIKVSNQVNMLLLPGFRSSVVPPDVKDPTCSPTVLDASACIVTVYDKDSLGGWVDTNASVFGLASTDRFTGAAQLKVAAPHFKMPEYETVRTANPCPYIPTICGGQPAGTWGYTETTTLKSPDAVKELNLAYFRMFLSSGFLMNSFGLKPAEANASTLSVKRTMGAESTTPLTTYTPSATGLLVDSQGIGFSAPVMSVSRVLPVKRGKPVTAATLIKAAGVAAASKFGTPTVQVNTKAGMGRVGKNYRFTKAGEVSVTVKYKSSKKTTSTRVLKVQVG